MQNTIHRIRSTLSQVAWLQRCDEAAIAQLAHNARLEHASAGTRVAWRGRNADYILIVEDGFLDISMTSIEGKRHFLYRQGRGQVFGLIAVLEHGAWVHDAEASSFTSFIRISGDDWRGAMQMHPDLNNAVIRLLCTRLRRSFESQAAQALTTTHARLARTLLSLCKDADDLVILMSQAELADMLGTTRQSLNLELKQLARIGVVRLRRNRVEVCDLTHLSQVAGHFD